MSSANDKQKRRLALQAHKAAWKGHIHGVQTALDGGMEIEAKDKHGRSLLHIAALAEKTPLVKYLLERGANADTRDNEGNSILHALVYNYKAPLLSEKSYKSGYRPIATMLYSVGLSIDSRNNDGFTAFHLAIKGRYHGFVDWMIDAGADPMVKTQAGQTAAAYATEHYKSESDKIYQYEERCRRLAVRPALPAPKLEPDLKKVEAPEPVMPAIASSKWEVTDADEIAHISVKKIIDCEVTELFNFSSGIYTRVLRNLKTNAESQSMRFFDEFRDRRLLETAYAEFQRQGGTGGESPVRGFDKPFAGKGLS